MEWKIGEMKQVNGKWYQCIEQPKDYIDNVCKTCDFSGRGNCELDRCRGTYRSDGKSVIFKKLEKVGEPFYCSINNIWKQSYKLLSPIPKESSGIKDYWYDIHGDNYVNIEIKEEDNNKETINMNNMEKEKEIRIQLTENEYYKVKEKLDSLVRDLNLSKRIMRELFSNKDNEERKSKMKPFYLEFAKQGKPVCTRDGRKARIICFDKAGSYPIVALVKKNEREENTCFYTEAGKSHVGMEELDLMMLPEKKEGWMNIYKFSLYNTEEEALKSVSAPSTYIRTIKIEYEDK